MARPSKIDEKRTALIAVAEKCFAKYGFTKTTLEDVALAAKMSKATLYHYFQNKDALFLAVILQVASDGVEAILKTTVSQKPLQKQLQYFFIQRLALYMKLVKLNALSKESLLQLQANFEQMYNTAKEKEMLFITSLLQTAYPKETRKTLRDFVVLLFQTMDALKHDAVFVGNLLEEEVAAISVLEKQIQQTLIIYTNYFKN